MKSSDDSQNKPDRPASKSLASRKERLKDVLQRQTQHFLSISNLGDWGLDPFQLDKDSEGHPLAVITYGLLQDYQLVDAFSLDSRKVRHFLNEVEKGYFRSNPYHNSVHAADVVHTMHCIIQQPELWKLLTKMDKLAAL